uniref:Uncharacterized protein n=1 Tax=Arundo donax TaxID=35708 RepID=A0A0A8Y7H6_ARUDO
MPFIMVGDFNIISTLMRRTNQVTYLFSLICLILLSTLMN